jgi:hypothetical protein
VCERRVQFDGDDGMITSNTNCQHAVSEFATP